MARKARYIDGSVIKPATIPSDAFEAGALGTTSIADLGVTTAKLAASAVTAAKLADGALTGSKPANVATTGALPGIPVIWEVDVAAGSANYDVVVPNKCRIINMWAHKSAANGGAGDTIQLKTSGGAANISDAVSLNTSVDGGNVGAASLDPTNSVVAAGTTLRLVATQVTNCECRVHILGILVA